MLLMVGSGEAALLRRRGPRSRSGTLALRRRIHVSPLITDPGTVEAEFNAGWTEGDVVTIPSTFKWTPEGSSIGWGRTEWSASFDVLDIAPDNGRRVTHATDHVTIAATSLLLDGVHWNLAIAPTLTVGVREGGATRGGVSAICRYDLGRSSLGSTLTWSGATNPDSDIPAGTWDWGTGAGVALSRRWTVHGDTQWERSTGYQRTWSLFEGLEFQATERLAVDLSVQHFNVVGGVSDRQMVLGLTVNLGRPSHWLR